MEFEMLIIYLKEERDEEFFKCEIGVMPWRENFHRPHHGNK